MSLDELIACAAAWNAAADPTTPTEASGAARTPRVAVPFHPMLDTRRGDTIGDRAAAGLRTATVAGPLFDGAAFTGSAAPPADRPVRAA